MAGNATQGERATKGFERVTSDASNLPLLQRKIFAPYKIATLVDTASDHGIAAETALAGTGLSPAEIHDPHVMTSIADYIAACENIVSAGADSSVAFDVGSRLHLPAYGMYGYALMSSPTVRDFCDFAIRYHLLATPMLHMSWGTEGKLAIWEFSEIYRSAMSNEVRDFIVRQQMMMTVTHFRDIAGADVRPLKALFGLPDRNSSTRDALALGCPCTFGGAAHQLHYPADLLSQVPRFANRLSHAWLEETCDELLGRATASSGLADEISRLLTKSPSQPFTMPSVAELMGMSERTLRRRLRRENSRFCDIIDDVRKMLALRFVQTTRMSADDIASKVGFSDTANLRRALKRWTGHTFGQLRRQ